MEHGFNYTKILATVGPAVDSEEKIQAMLEGGVNGFRLNCSHGDDAERERQIGWIRKYAREMGRQVAIVQDLQGPKIRLGDIINNHYEIHKGDELILEADPNYHHDGSFSLPVQYNLVGKAKEGETIYLFDGHIRAKVTGNYSETGLKIRAENDGYVMSRKGLNVPETDFGGDIITEKDLHDIEVGSKLDYDYVALSFVQGPEDITRLRELLEKYDSRAKILAKVETKRATENLEAIVEAADGIMVARGDMAVEIGIESVPIIQQQLAALCRKHSKLCIVATQMMMSMVNAPEPTRAEVSDVANAVVQEADVVMLSDETANGQYPIETIREMRKIILNTQKYLSQAVVLEPEDGTPPEYDAISDAAANLAKKIKADVIVCQTASGATAEAMAAERPLVPIIVATSRDDVANRLAMRFGVVPFVREYSVNYAFDLTRELVSKGILGDFDNNGTILAVMVSGGKDVEGGRTDTIKVRHFEV